MLELVLDEGNSSIKYGLFESGQLIDSGRIKGKDGLEGILSGKDIHKGILSSVKREEESIGSILGKEFLVVHRKSPMPIEIDYETPETLGIDRLVAGVGGLTEFPGRDFIVVDLGTCITADLVISGKFLGGWIIPGLEMQLKSMNHYTSKLPLLSFRKEQFHDFGKSTDSSMKSGVKNLVEYGLNGFFQMQRQKHPGLIMIMTGGDLPVFESSIKEPIFARPNLNLSGLYRILKFNDEVN